MGHWYTADGKPMHTFTGKDGEQRDTTLREARKFNLFPSVTTINKATSGSKQLTDWITNQALLSAINHPGGIPSFARAGNAAIDDKDAKVKAFLDWCRDDSYKQVRDKAELGNAIHDALNKSFTDPDEVPAHFLAHVHAVRDLLARTFGADRVWDSEVNFASVEEGFGGSIDLESRDGDLITLDFKCKEFDEEKDIKRMVFDEHAMQIGGYQVGRKRVGGRGVNVFVSTSHPGLVKMYEHTPEALARGIEMFRATRDFWFAANKYDPRIKP